LPPDTAAALLEAALQHHQPLYLRDSSLSRLMGDLGFQADSAFDDKSTTRSKLAEQILVAFQSRVAPDENDQAAHLARVLEAANCFDEQLEYAPFEQDGIEKVLDQAVEEQRLVDEALGFVLNSLRCSSREELGGVMEKLPVYPAIAMRLYRLLSNAEVSFSMLESIAKADQVIAGKLVKAANSVYYSPWQPIRTVAQAVSYVGTRDAGRILLASSIQPLFALPRLRQLWKHAIEAGQVAERIAELSGGIEPGEAFLLGLLHDVGKLAITLLSKEINESIDRLMEKGCQPAVSELVLCGFDHAEAGAEVLRHWKFSEEMITAVRYHHQPERTGSVLSAVLYLTEFWCDSEEDIPSNARLYTAMKLAGVTPEALEEARISFNGALSGL
jgi:putative nucleotidyltransferase with HDIG domain